MQKKIELQKSKEKIVAVSYFNFLFSSLLIERKIDFFRCDLNEISEILGYKNPRKVLLQDVLLFTKNYFGDIPLSVDLPLSILFERNTVSVERIVDFYVRSNADYLSIDLSYFEYDSIKKIIEKNIPMIAYSVNQNKEDDFVRIKEQAVEFQSAGGTLCILTDYSDDFVHAVKNSLNMPVLSETGSGCNGNYRRIFDLLGLSEKSNKMFNLKDAFVDTVDEYIFDSNKK